MAMNCHIISYEGLQITAPIDWMDITASLNGEEDVPFTLAKVDGVGALQFSIGLYQHGPIPNPSAAELLKMAVEYGKAKSFSAPFDIASDEERLRIGAASYRWDSNFMRVWYVSDGNNFAFVTYVCDWNLQGPEIEESEQIVYHLAFPNAVSSDSA